MNVNVWKLLLNFRDNKMGHIGTKIWMLFLISIFFEDNEDFHSNVTKIDIQGMNEYLELILSYQKQIDTQLIIEQRAIQSDMLNLCNFIMQPKELDIFERKTDHIVKVLESIQALKEKYINKDGTGCFATLTSSGNKYVAISGLYYDRGYFESLIRTTLGNTYELIKSDIHTRYYYKKKKHITYGMYTDKKSKCGKIKNIRIVGRMFSCCGKKLLGELFSKPIQEKYTMHIKKKPCDMCLRAIKAYDELSVEKSYILYPKGVKKYRLNPRIGEFDRVAKEISNI